MGIQAIAGIALFTVPLFANAQLNVDIYSGFGLSGGGAPYSGLVGSFGSGDIKFATNNGYNWHPFGQDQFGADITGCINVEKRGDYTFTLDSDDGSQLWIDGGLVVDDGGAHSPNVVSGSVSLTPGVHTLEVQFFEAFGGPSGVDLWLPGGVSYTNCVPEPGTIALLIGAGVSGAGMLLRRRRKN